MITKFKIFEYNENDPYDEEKWRDDDQNILIWEGNPYWIGLMDIKGNILNMWTFQTASEGDFHPNFYLSEEEYNLWEKEKSILFWVDQYEDKIVIDPNYPMPANVEFYTNNYINKIKSQLDNEI